MNEFTWEFALAFLVGCFGLPLMFGALCNGKNAQEIIFGIITGVVGVGLIALFSWAVYYQPNIDERMKKWERLDNPEKYQDE